MQPDILDALRHGDHGQALALSRAAVAATPDDPQAHRALAFALRAGGDTDAARESLERAIALAPDDADLYFQRAGFLLGARQLAEAEHALVTSVGLDPNQFGAYILQAQLALGRGDLDKATRLGRLAARLAPDHPWLQALEGTLALRRGDADGALAQLSAAAAQSPDEPQLRYALGFAYMAKGHHAFAEQAFRGVLEASPDALSLHGLIAGQLQQQGRMADAADALAPMLDDPAIATPPLRRYAGELELVAGRLERALPHLRAALAAMPGDGRTLAAICDAWRRANAGGDARATLDAALATSPGESGLWQARATFSQDPVDAATVIDRWLAAMPAHLPALDMRMHLLATTGDADGAEAAAAEIVAIEPGRSEAELRLIDAKLRRDPASAVAHIEGLLAKATLDDTRRLLRQWLAMALDRAGAVGRAAALWIEGNAEVAGERLPLPPMSGPEAIAALPPIAAATASDAAGADTVRAAFLVGVPGSLVERLAAALLGTVEAFRADRFGASPPDDALQNYHTPGRLASGETTPADVAASWLAALPARGLGHEAVDWLLWWDNALLAVLRAELPDAALLVALRDPRDMLLDWLAFGAPAPFALASPVAAAGWLAASLDHVATLHEQDLFPHALLRLDDIADDPDALAQALGAALKTTLPVAPAGAFGPPHFAAGHWRAYAVPLEEAFALLAPVAVRLGYPEA